MISDIIKVLETLTSKTTKGELSWEIHTKGFPMWITRNERGDGIGLCTHQGNFVRIGYANYSIKPSEVRALALFKALLKELPINQPQDVANHDSNNKPSYLLGCLDLFLNNQPPVKELVYNQFLAEGI